MKSLKLSALCFVFVILSACAPSKSYQIAEVSGGLCDKTEIADGQNRVEILNDNSDYDVFMLKKILVENGEVVDSVSLVPSKTKNSSLGAVYIDTVGCTSKYNYKVDALINDKKVPLKVDLDINLDMMQ